MCGGPCHLSSSGTLCYSENSWFIHLCSFFFSKIYKVPLLKDSAKTFQKESKEEDILLSVKVTIFCGCYIIGECLLWADFGSQHYWLWATPDARVGWAMSSERTELMSVPWGGCLSFWPGNCVKTHNLQNPSESELSGRLRVHQSALNDPVQLWDSKTHAKKISV